MLPTSTQDSMEVDNISVASSSAKNAQTPPPQRHGSLGNETNATKVFVRVRPFSAAERKQSGSGHPPAIVTVNEENPCHITTLDPSKQYMPKSTYVFDRCFNSAEMHPAAGEDANVLLQDGKDRCSFSLSTLEDVSAEALLNPLQLDCLARDQANVYGHVGRPVLLNALAGYNGCVFAYGQTGSGKTYTMMGPPGTFGAVVTSTAAAAGPSSTSGAGAASAKKFRRAATGYAGTGRTPQDTSGVDDTGDSRFQSYASMTPRALPRTPPATDASSTPDVDLSPRVGGDKTPKGGGAAAKAGGVEGDEGLQGIVPRLIRDLFAELHLKRERDSSHSFRVEVEYYEIYREKVMDLLGSHSANNNTELRVRQSKTSGPYVENLKKKHVEDERQIFRLLRQGNLRRHTASTAMNDRSSRSHAIFVLHLVQMHITDHDSSSAKVSSKVNLVDLAGSEKTGAHNAEGDQFKEGVVINISLTVLGRVIDALADKSQGKRNVFCPFRDSVLTWLLMDSLGGNSKTTMVATVSPHCTNFDEACQTLRYASRAKQIVTKVVVNEDPQVRQIKMLTAEVQRLKALLAAEGKPADTDEDVEALQDRIHALEGELNETRAELEEKSAELSTLLALRRNTSSLPSTLKAGNAGVAGTVKELSKAKSDVRRLEAENLLHLQTEEELHRSLERVKTLELKYTQLLTDLRDTQETTKRLEKDKQERDRRIVELQQQLFQERTKLESPQAASTRTVSPSEASVQSATLTSTTVASPTRASTAPQMAPSPSSAAERRATRKATPGKKVGAKKAKSGDAAVTNAEPEWEAERAELCAQFEEEKKLLSLQVQERADAYRKSQLDVKKLKVELKSEQEALQGVEKRLNDQHAEAMRRLQEEVQELRRSIKEERKTNKDIRQMLSGPVEKRPAFSFQFVRDTVQAQETTSRDGITAAEEEARYRLCEIQRISQERLEHAARDAAAHVAEVERLHEANHENLESLAHLRADHDKLQAVHDALVKTNDENVARIADLKVEQEDTLVAKGAMEDLYQQEIAQQEEQLDALRALNAEMEATAATQTKREQELSEKVASLQQEVQTQKEQLSEEALAREQQQHQHATAIDAATASAAALQAAHTQHVDDLHREHAAAVAALEATTHALQAELAQVQAQLHTAEQDCAAEHQRGVDRTAQHEQAVADLEAQVAAEKESTARAAESHRAALLQMEEQLAVQEAEAAATTAALQRQLDEVQETLHRVSTEGDRTVHDLNSQLASVRDDLSKSEEARAALLKQNAEHTAALEEQLMAIREELDAEKTSKATAGDEYTATLEKVTTEMVEQQQQFDETRGALSQQIVELQQQLAAAQKAHEAEAQRNVEESAAHSSSLAQLRAELEKEKAAQNALSAAHAEELQKHRDAQLRDEAAAQAAAAESAQRLQALREEKAAADAQHAQQQAELAQQLEASRAELHRSEESRKQQIQRAVEQAGEHAKALEEVRAQLAAEQASAADAAAAHEEEVRNVEAKHREETAAAATAAAALQQQLDELRSTLQEEQARSSKVVASLEETLEAVRGELHRSEEARKAHIQRSLEQASIHEEQRKELTAQLTAAGAAAQAQQKQHDLEVSALQKEWQTKEDAAAKQIANLQDEMRRQEESHQSQLLEKEKAVVAAEEQTQRLQEEVNKSEAARKAYVEKSLAQAAASAETIAQLQSELEKQRNDAVAAAAQHATQLAEVQRQLEQKTASAEATAAALHRELENQRQAAAAQATQHARTAKELEDKLAASHAEFQKAAEAHQRELGSSAKEAEGHVAALAALQAQLTEAGESHRAADAAHEEVLRRVKAELTQKYEEKAVAAAKLEQQWRNSQAKLAQSEKAREEQAEEGMQQAEAHTKSLESLQRMLETAHKQQVAAMKKSHADYVATLEGQVAAQTASVKALRDDLQDARQQMKQMVETQNYLGKQLESEKQTSSELRERADSTEKARAAAAAEALQLQKELHASNDLVDRKTKESAELQDDVQRAREEVAAARQQLSEQALQLSQQEENAKIQSTSLEAAQQTASQLREEIAALKAEKAALLKAQAAQAEQQVDTVTEFETQFRAMEREHSAVTSTARQKEESLLAIIDKQAKEIQQMREDLDFNISMNHLESSNARLGNAPSTALSQGGGGAEVNRSSTPIPTGGTHKVVGNGSFASRSASPAVGSSMTAGVTGMLSSFFRRNTAGAMPAPTTVNAAGPHNATQVVQRRGSVLHSRVGGGGGESRVGATTPVRRASNFYTTSSFRASPMPSFLGRVEATGSSAGAGLGTRTVSNASLDSYVVEQEVPGQSPVENNTPGAFFPTK